MSIVWQTKSIQIKDLKEYADNPRNMSRKDFEKLVANIKRNGYRNRISVDVDNTIVGGHSRKQALLKAGFNPTDTIEVLYPNRALTKKEFQDNNVSDNLIFGSFDMDMLANKFDYSELIEWGLPSEMLGVPDSESSIAELQDKPIANICEQCGKVLK